MHKEPNHRASDTQTVVRNTLDPEETKLGETGSEMLLILLPAFRVN